MCLVILFCYIFKLLQICKLKKEITKRHPTNSGPFKEKNWLIKQLIFVAVTCNILVLLMKKLKIIIINKYNIKKNEGPPSKFCTGSLNTQGRPCFGITIK